MVKKAIRWLDKYFEEALMVALLATIAVVMLLQVIMRYVFSASLSWAEELTRYCFIYSAFLGLGYCVRNNKMLKVDIIMTVLPKAAQVALDLVGKVVTLVFFAYLCYGTLGVVAMSRAGRLVSPAMELPMYIIYLSTTIGFTIATLRQAQDLYRTVRAMAGAAERGKKPLQEPPQGEPILEKGAESV